MIAVVGDFINDYYSFFKTIRKSPEGNHSIVEFIEKKQFPGGAGAVACMLLGLGFNLDEFQLVMPTKPFSNKNRIVVDDKIILRIDQDYDHEISQAMAAVIVQKIIELEATTVIVADYGKGVVTDDLWNMLKQLNVILIVDPYTPKRPLEFYKGASILLPNRRDLKLSNPVNISYVINNLSVLTTQFPGTKICLKLDHQGMVFTRNEGDGMYVHISPKEVNVVDVCGAGDMVTAVIAAALYRGYDWVEACEMANDYAAKKCEQFGATLVDIPIAKK